METGSEGRRRRSFTREYKAEVVELCRTSGRTIATVARDLGLTETAVRRWVAQAEIDAGQRDGLTTAEREELSRLRKEVRVLREERDVLKRATVFMPNARLCRSGRGGERPTGTDAAGTGGRVGIITAPRGRRAAGRRAGSGRAGRAAT
ncbi:MAG: transposase [Dehalococcoidia bacterium]|nr:transposase [Dehalococcoidia bacterium]